MKPNDSIEPPSLTALSTDANNVPFREWLAVLPVGAYLCDRDGLITYFNDRAVELWRRAPALNDPADRFCGSFKLYAVDGSPIPHDKCWMALALESGREYKGREVIIERTDGSRVAVLAHTSPMRDAMGEIVGAVNLLVDIADRKRSEQALQESEQRFRTLADNIAQLAWMADETGWIFWYNKRWFDYTGTTLEEMQGWGWQKVHHPDHVDRVVEKIRGCFHSGEIWEDTFPLRGKDGAYRWFLSRAIPIREAGKVVRWFGTNTDVTAQREAEELLRQADRRKDEFLAMLAHELRNPLAPISNSLHLLRLAEDVDPAIQKLHEIMERQTNQLIRLVDDLLDVSRITQNKIELRTELVDLAAVVRSAVETSRPMIDAASHQLALVLPAEPLTLKADPVRLAQVIANLLNNAAKYTPQGGQIWLTAAAEQGEAVIQVRDNGVGIAPEMLTHVFDKFAQVGGAQGHFGGLGIGLTLARNLIHLHGGRLEAHSEGADKGSRFTVRLPLAVAASQTGTGDAAPAVRATQVGRQVLVVDDARDSAFILGKLLEAIGQRVVVARDGVSALELACRERPDIVISDIAMAEMDGYELARRLRQQFADEPIVLVALTGYGQDSDRQRAKEAGFDHHLVKPVSAEQLGELFAALPERSVPAT